MNRHQQTGPQNELQQLQHSQSTGVDSDAEFDDGQVYDTAFLNDLNRVEAQQLNTANVAPSPSKRRLRVANNAPDYLHREASRRANAVDKPSPSPLPTSAGPSSQSTAAPAVLPEDVVGVLAAVGFQNLSPEALAHVAGLLHARQQPALEPNPDAQILPQLPPQNPSQQATLGGLESLLAIFRTKSGGPEASAPSQQLAAQRSVSLPCATPQLVAPPQLYSARSASVAPIVRGRSDAAPSPSFDKAIHAPPPASSDQHPVLEKNPGSTLPVSPPSPLDESTNQGKADKKPRQNPAASTSSPKRSGGRPTKEQTEIVANSFRDMDETLFNAASVLNSDPQSVLNRYLRRFNIGYKSNPWNHYESWAKSPENVLMEMERLAGTEHDAVYQEFMKSPNRKPTVDEMRLTWPLFQAEHGEEKAKDLLAAWNSVCEMDAGFVVQSKGERKRVWEGHVRRLNNFLDMLRNVFQMHVFAIGVGGQVNTDAGLHFVYQNYESKGFAESGFLKSIDHLIAFFKTHIYRETKDQYTDQEIVAMAQQRGYSVVRDPNALPSPVADAAPKQPVSSPPIRPAPPLLPISTASGALARGTLSPAPSSNGGTDVAMQDASDGDSSSGDDDETLGKTVGKPNIDVQKALVALLAKCNLTLGKSGSFPWLSLSKECFKRGVQVLNFPGRVALPWKPSKSGGGGQKKGVKALKLRHQQRLAAAIGHPEYPLTFKLVEAIDLHTDVLPIMTFAPNPKGVRRQAIFAKDISNLTSLRAALGTKRKPAKRPKIETPEPEIGNQSPLATTAISLPPVSTAPPATQGGGARSKALKSKPIIESDSEDEDELDIDDGDSDIYGLQVMGHDDEEYQLESERSPKRKRAGKGSGKGKEKADVNLTPKPLKKPAATLKALENVGFTSSDRIAENKKASAILGRNIPLSELDFQPANVPGASSYDVKVEATSYSRSQPAYTAGPSSSRQPTPMQAVQTNQAPAVQETTPQMVSRATKPRPQPAYAPGASSSRQPAATLVQEAQPIQMPAVQGAMPRTAPWAAPSVPIINIQGLQGISGAAGRARPQAPSPTASASTQAPNPSPIDAAPVLQGAVTATASAPQPTASVALEMLQKFGFTSEQILALAQLGGTALGNGLGGGGAA
ncbi:hypothetical protein V5O48_008826 [Marasmius crinis-equi]|uniref:UBA domain-containing protein n=1 Tax=Marasmius crinis-equi TaxID=585013 RepID=A0ABR3FDE8_9AGAR